LTTYKTSVKKYTFGYIRHKQDVHDRYLGYSLSKLQGEFDVISTSDADFPAANYNTMLAQCQTEYLILTHQDVSFPPDLLAGIDATIAHLPSFGALGLVGRDVEGNYRWSTPQRPHEVDTLDCCFLVVRRDTPSRFDTVNFGEYHLYVEDFCAQITRLRGQKVYTLLIESGEHFDSLYQPGFEPVKLVHHSATVSKQGFAWGRYHEFRATLERKWGVVQTT
jgi:hypothetical protein